MNKGFEVWKVSHCKLLFFIVEPVNVVDLMVYTQEHVKLHHGSSGKTMCQGKGLGPFYDCYHRIAKSAPKCALPTTQGLINKDIIGRNCTTYGEIKQFQSDFIGSMYKVQDSCPRPCQIHSYELQVYDSFFCSWIRITVFYITLHTQRIFLDWFWRLYICRSDWCIWIIASQIQHLSGTCMAVLILTFLQKYAYMISLPS